MLNSLLKGVLSGVVLKLMDHYRHLSIQLLKIEATKAYLQGVRMARLSAMGLLWLNLLVILVGLGLLLVHVGVFLLLPWTVEAKAVLAIILGLAYMAVGGLTLYSSMSEKTWMKQSGATAMLNEATGPAKQ